jgi:mRNA interferase RelE/StbE
VNWSVIWHPRAADALADLAKRDPATARRIRQRVAAFAQSGQGDLKKLEGRGSTWRLRVGSWRVIFTFDPPGSITVLAVSDRRDAYH